MNYNKILSNYFKKNIISKILINVIATLFIIFTSIKEVPLFLIIVIVVYIMNIYDIIISIYNYYNFNMNNYLKKTKPNIYNKIINELKNSNSIIKNDIIFTENYIIILNIKPIVFEYKNIVLIYIKRDQHLKGITRRIGLMLNNKKKYFFEIDFDNEEKDIDFFKNFIKQKNQNILIGRTPKNLKTLKNKYNITFFDFLKF